MNSGISPPLRDLQRAFAYHLLPRDHTAPRTPIAALVADDGIGAVRRLQVYHHAYRMRLLEALRDSYGHTLLYLGDDAFNAAALAYVEVHPSQHASLRWYGQDLPAFLGLRLTDEPEVAELALLDRTLRLAFDGPDAAPLTLDAVARMAPAQWADLPPRLHPTCTQLQLRFNTLALWQAVDQEHDAPPAAELQQPGDLLVWRRGHQPHFRSLSPMERDALAQLQQGATFGDLCVALATRYPEVDAAAETGGLLRRWIDDELLQAHDDSAAA